MSSSKDTAGTRTGAARSLVDRIHDELHRLITEGKLEDGERLVIDRLARQFGTSLIPVREALARLKAEGLIDMEHNKGYRVAPPPSMEQLRWLFEARVVIETGAVDIALANGTAVDLKELRAINRQIARGTYGRTFNAFRDFVLLNERFHVRLVALAGNEVLDAAYQRIGYHQQITRPIFGSGVGDIDRIVEEHDRIVDAIEKGDKVGARKAITAHVLTGFDKFVPAGRRHARAPTVSAARRVSAPGRASKKPPAQTVASPAQTKAP